MVENKIVLYYKACKIILRFIPLENQSYFHKVDSIFEQQFFNQSLCIKVGKGNQSTNDFFKKYLIIYYFIWID